MVIFAHGQLDPCAHGVVSVVELRHEVFSGPQDIVTRFRGGEQAIRQGVKVIAAAHKVVLVYPHKRRGRVPTGTRVQGGNGVNDATADAILTEITYSARVGNVRSSTQLAPNVSWPCAAPAGGTGS